jgi:hypothetical protein
MNKFYVLFFSMFFATICVAQTNLNLGEVMISGYYGDSFDGEDGCGDSFAFVSYVPLAPGTTIRFSEADYHQWADDNEGDLAWTNTTGSTIAALTNINIVTSNQELSCGAAPIADIGSAVYEVAVVGAFWSFSTSNEEIIVYQGPGPRAANTFISIFLSDATSNFPDNVPQPLLNSNSLITFEGIEDDADVAVYNGPTTFSSLTDFKAQLTNVSGNWAFQDEGGGVDNGKDGVFPDYPDDLLDFPGNLSVTGFEDVSISYYPNPVSNNLFLDSKLSISDVVLYNTIGKIVYRNSSLADSNNQIDMSGFQQGIYFLKVSIGEETQTLKVIKK